MRVAASASTLRCPFHDDSHQVTSEISNLASVDGSQLVDRHKCISFRKHFNFTLNLFIHFHLGTIPNSNKLIKSSLNSGRKLRLQRGITSGNLNIYISLNDTKQIRAVVANRSTFDLHGIIILGERFIHEFYWNFLESFQGFTVHNILIQYRLGNFHA